MTERKQRWEMNNLDLKKKLKRFRKAEDGCHVWLGAKTKAGSFYYGSVWDGKKSQLAHRLSYKLNIGEIPKGLTIDHSCKNKLCINPQHLRVMSLSQNILLGNSPTAKNKRKKKCIHGHLLSGSNLYIRKNGRRQCVSCNNLRRRKYWKEQRFSIQKKEKLRALEGKD